ncbi:MAG: AAA family ATPase [Deltaproteobacteria bacterium]|nr:AAA family ATPase [Deltaproteobacteria bacterium]
MVEPPNNLGNDGAAGVGVVGPVSAPENTQPYVRFPVAQKTLYTLVALGLFKPGEGVQLYPATESGEGLYYYGFPESQARLQAVIARLQELKKPEFYHVGSLPSAEPEVELDYTPSTPEKKPEPPKVHFIQLAAGTPPIIIGPKFFDNSLAYLQEHLKDLSVAECAPLANDRFAYKPFYMQASALGQAEVQNPPPLKARSFWGYNFPVGAIPLRHDSAQEHLQLELTQNPELTLCRRALTVTLDDFKNLNGFLQPPAGQLYWGAYGYFEQIDRLHSKCETVFQKFEKLELSLPRETAEHLVTIGLLTPGDQICNHGPDNIRAGNNIYLIRKNILPVAHKQKILENLKLWIEDGQFQDNQGKLVPAPKLDLPPELLQSIRDKLEDELLDPDEAKSLMDEISKWIKNNPLSMAGISLLVIIIGFYGFPWGWEAIRHRFDLDAHRQLVSDLTTWNGRDAMNLADRARDDLTKPLGKDRPILPAVEWQNQTLVLKGSDAVLDETRTAEMSVEQGPLRGLASVTKPEGGKVVGEIDATRSGVAKLRAPRERERKVTVRPLQVRTIAWDLGDGRRIQLALYTGEQFPSQVYLIDPSGQARALQYDGVIASNVIPAKAGTHDKAWQSRSGQSSLAQYSDGRGLRILISPSVLGGAPTLYIPPASETLAVTKPKEQSFKVKTEAGGRYEIRFSRGPNEHPTEFELFTRTQAPQTFRLVGFLHGAQERHFWGNVGIYENPAEPHSPPLYLAFSRHGTFGLRRGARVLLTADTKTFDRGRRFFWGQAKAPDDMQVGMENMVAWEETRKDGLRAAIAAERDKREASRDALRERAASVMVNSGPPVIASPTGEAISPVKPRGLPRPGGLAMTEDVGLAMTEASVADLEARLAAEQRATEEFQNQLRDRVVTTLEPIAASLNTDVNRLRLSLEIANVHEVTTHLLFRAYADRFGVAEGQSSVVPELDQVRLSGDFTEDMLREILVERRAFFEGLMGMDSPLLERCLAQMRIAGLQGQAVNPHQLFALDPNPVVREGAPTSGPLVVDAQTRFVERWVPAHASALGTVYRNLAQQELEQARDRLTEAERQLAEAVTKQDELDQTHKQARAAWVRARSALGHLGQRKKRAGADTTELPPAAVPSGGLGLNDERARLLGVFGAKPQADYQKAHTAYTQARLAYREQGLVVRQARTAQKEAALQLEAAERKAAAVQATEAKAVAKSAREIQLEQLRTLEATRITLETSTHAAAGSSEPIRPELLVDASERLATTESTADAEERRFLEGLPLGDGLVALSVRSKPVNPKYRERLDPVKYPMLTRFGYDMTYAAAAGELNVIIGRQAELDKMDEELIDPEKGNVAPTGGQGVGKTGVVEGKAIQLVHNDVPIQLRGKRLIRLDIAAMVAGTKYRGEFEERLKGAIKEVLASEGEVVIFIDELHVIVKAGAAEGASGAGDILKEALARRGFQMVGATTDEEWERIIEGTGWLSPGDKALGRRFLRIPVKEPSFRESLAMLLGRRRFLEQHYNVAISAEALEAAILGSSAYIKDRFLPDKAFDLVKEASAAAAIGADLRPQAIRDIEARFEIADASERSALEAQHRKLMAEWQRMQSLVQKIRSSYEALKQAEAAMYDALGKGDHAEAGQRGTAVLKARENLRTLQTRLAAMEKTTDVRWPTGRVEAADVIAVLAKKTGKPVSEIADRIDFERAPECSPERLRVEVARVIKERERIEAELAKPLSLRAQQGEAIPSNPSEIASRTLAMTEGRHDTLELAQGETWESRLEAEQEKLKLAQQRLEWEPKIKKSRIVHAQWQHGYYQSMRHPSDRVPWDKAFELAIWAEAVDTSGLSYEEYQRGFEQALAADRQQAEGNRIELNKQIREAMGGLQRAGTTPLPPHQMTDHLIVPPQGMNLQQYRDALLAQLQGHTQKVSALPIRAPLNAANLLATLRGLATAGNGEAVFWSHVEAMLRDKPFTTVEELFTVLRNQVGEHMDPAWLRRVIAAVPADSTPEELALAGIRGAIIIMRSADALPDTQTFLSERRSAATAPAEAAAGNGGKGGRTRRVRGAREATTAAGAGAERIEGETPGEKGKAGGPKIKKLK